MCMFIEYRSAHLDALSAHLGASRQLQQVRLHEGPDTTQYEDAPESPIDTSRWSSASWLTVTGDDATAHVDAMYIRLGGPPHPTPALLRVTHRVYSRTRPCRRQWTNVTFALVYILTWLVAIAWGVIICLCPACRGSTIDPAWLHESTTTSFSFFARLQVVGPAASGGCRRQQSMCRRHQILHERGPEAPTLVAPCIPTLCRHVCS